jgi:hypothetical protein
MWTRIQFTQANCSHEHLNNSRTLSKLSVDGLQIDS